MAQVICSLLNCDSIARWIARGSPLSLAFDGYDRLPRNLRLEKASDLVDSIHQLALRLDASIPVTVDCANT